MNPKANHGLFQAIQCITESTEGDYAPKYDQSTGTYHIEHTPSGRIVARGVAVSGGAALSQAAAYNADPKRDKNGNPSHEHLMDLALSHHDLKTSQHILNNSPFHSYAAAKAVNTAVESSGKHLDAVHKTFAHQNPDHEHAARNDFDQHVRETHDRILSGMIEDGAHHG